MDASPDLPRQSRAPVFNMPRAVTLSIGLLLAVHAVREFVLPVVWDFRLVFGLALVPARWTVWLDPQRVTDVVRAAAVAGDPEASAVREMFVRSVLADRSLEPWTLATYALLHGSWLHVILNSVWLAAFGSPVARRCGALRYGLIALAGIVAGGLLHIAVAPLSAAPLVGASAGISAVMAAAARFVFQPPVSAYRQPWQLPPRRPAETIPELMRNRTAVAFLAVWLVTNILFGLASLPLASESAAIAWDAHLGGFLAGFLLFPLLDPRDGGARLPGPER